MPDRAAAVVGVGAGCRKDEVMTGLDKETYEKMVEELTKSMTTPIQSMWNLTYKPMEITLPEPERENNNFRFMSRMWGMPIYTSNYLPTITETKVRGISSARKANSRRPFYRKVTIKKNAAYLVGGQGIVAPVGYFASMV